MPDHEQQTGAEEKTRNGPDHPTARLARAVKSGDAQAFERALGDGGDALSVSILINASRRGELAMAQELMGRGARPEALDRRGFSALYHAFRQSDEPMLRLLLEGAPNKLGLIEAGLAGESRRARKTLFESACADGDAKAVGLLMDVAGKKPVGQEFYMAVGSGSEACAQKVWSGLSDFEKTRVKADAVNTLARAAEAGNLWAMRLALDELGADLEAHVSRAAPAGYGMSRRRPQRALDAAAAAGALEAMEELLARGASVKALPGEESPLFACLGNGDGERAAALIRLLGRFGADPNEPTPSGRLPLAEACGLSGNAERVRALLELGADPNQYGAGHETPLHRALAKKNMAAVAALLEFGADPALRQGPSAEEIMRKTLSTEDLARSRAAQEAFELKQAAGAATGSRRKPGL